jgi:oxaloacetate decarboxylase gamma subunit
MTIAEMLGQSGVLTLLGMGVVFSFLLILIVCVSAAGKIIQALGGEKDLNAPAGGAGPASAAGTKAVTAAISAAVNEYRKTESR